MEFFYIGLDIMGIATIFVILMCVLFGKKNAMNQYYPILLLIHTLTLCMDILACTTVGVPSAKTFYTLAVVFVVSFSYISVAGINLYVDTLLYRGGKRNPLGRVVPFAISFSMIVLWASSLPLGEFFIITDGATFEKGMAYYAFCVPGILVLLFDLGRIVSNWGAGRLSSGTAIGVGMFLLFPLVTIVFSVQANKLSLFLGSLTIAYLSMYVSIHVKAENDALVHELTDAKTIIDVTISQLQPHFLYNSLTAIKYLCDDDAYLASEGITKFTKYLRYTMESIESDELVDAADEITHVKNYLWLEQLRFGDKLKVSYNVDVDHFELPPLTLQPLVENAVRHGVTKKMGGGEIQISTKESRHFYEVEIKDNGLGFDVDKVLGQEDADAKENVVGLTGIRARLKNMNNSRMTVESRPGRGTTVRIEIVKDEE